MKKFLTSVGTLTLLAPLLAFAAFDDVTLTTDVTLNTGDAPLTVTGSSAVLESIAVTSGSFSVVMPTNSSIKVTSANRYILSSNDEDVVVEEVCNSTLSSLNISNLKSLTKTVTVTVTASTCSEGGSGGGGGGGGGSSPPPAPTPAPTPAPLSSDVAILIAQLRSLIQIYASLGGAITPEMAAFAGEVPALPSFAPGAFTRDLQMGMTGSDVRALQVFLNTHGFIIAQSGGGSPGNETTLFGGLTKAALAKFQADNGITPPAGYFGPKTRTFINAM